MTFYASGVTTSVGANDGLALRYGFRLPVDDFVDRDLHSLATSCRPTEGFCWPFRATAPDFMTSAHALYRSFGFVTIAPWPWPGVRC